MHSRSRPINEGTQADLTAHHPGASKVLEEADAIGRGLDAGLDVDPTELTYTRLEILTWIMRREAHLCTARYLAMMQDGLPPDAAEMLAQDDMGFQLVRGLVSE